MYEQATEMLAEPSYIKENLPLAFVAEQYGVHLVAGEGRLHGICPFHADKNPSFDIYPWGEGERFGCFACGAGGDVLDFIMLMSGIGFRDACEAAKRAIVKMQQMGWVGPAVSNPLDWDEDAARDLLLRADADMEQVQTLINRKGWQIPSKWLVQQFGCRTMNGQLLVPFYTEDRRLVGIKHRALSGARSPITLPGSRLRSTLYGIQRAQHPTVLICEGESDVWTASWLLERWAVSVVGLPAGAGAAPNRLDLLQGRKVVIAFDGDEPGRLSAARWRDALGPSSVTIDLPDGHDITSITASDPQWLASRLESYA